MAFCSNCGVGVAENTRFCSACGKGLTSSATLSYGGRLKPFGIVMLVVGGLYLLMAMMRYNSAESVALRAFGGGTDPNVAMSTIWGLADAFVGILLFTAEPRIFLKLKRSGLIVFVILMALLPIFAWIPWLVPSLKEKQA